MFALVAGLLVAGDRVAAWAVARAAVAGVTTAARAEGHTVEGAALTFHGFPFATQLLGGSLERVTGSADRVSIGGHEVTDVGLVARGVEPRTPWRTQHAELDGTVTFATLAAVLGEQLDTDVDLTEAPGHPGGALLTTSVLGLTLGAVVEPAVRDATTIEVQVRAVSVAGVSVDADSLPGGLGSLLGALSFPLDLPDGVALDAAEVTADGFRIALTAHDITLAGLAS